MDISLKGQESTQVPRETRRAIREHILAFQEQLSRVPGAFFGDSQQCPLRHSFAPGIYVREIWIPAGIVLVGKLHRFSHPNFLMSGEAIVYTESTGSQHLIAPQVIISGAGTKRVVLTITNCHWVTVHANPDNITDVDALEKCIIADSYEIYDASQEALCLSSQ